MFENKSINETAKELSTDINNGLDDIEASKRLTTYGFNKLQEKKKKSIIAVFFSNFNDPMIFILLAAAVLSVIVGIVDHAEIAEIISDPLIILAVVLLNATIGTIQENKAEKSLEALKRMASQTCVVKRNGQTRELKAEELVPGDLVILEEGNTVPADLRLTQTINLKTDESSLTGESLPVEKDATYTLTDPVGVGDRINVAYMSTPVVYGRGEGIVISTGMNTETGKIAKMLAEDDNDSTPLQKKLAQLSKVLGFLTIGIVVFIFLVQMIGSLLQGIPFGSGRFFEEMLKDFMLAISLAVAAVPEGLPAVVTIVLALGVQRMVKVNTIVRKLPSVETLGAVSVVCSDKTGTLTQNKMTVTKYYIDGQLSDDINKNNKDLIYLAQGLALCSNAHIEGEKSFGDPTEIALIDLAQKVGFSKNDLENSYPRVDELPFDSNRKMMSTRHKRENNHAIFTKGAIDSILKHAKFIQENGEVRPLTEEDKVNIMAASDAMAKDALRILGLATKEVNADDNSDIVEEDLTFIGLVGMIDPARPEAKSAVEIFKQAGITTIMITGDHKTTALAIARDLGIASDENQVMSGDEIDALTPEELQEKVKTVRIFARVSPSNKVSIVKAIKANGNIAAMTGDGVNDAPSLKAADIGIAMGITGTDVAKGAADMILTDDNFASIEKAVEEGRGIYANIKKTVLFLLGSNIAEVITMFSVVLIALICNIFKIPGGEISVPLISAHILWINLVTDSVPAVALGVDPKDKNNMKEKPRSPKESLFSKGGIEIVIGYGVLIAFTTVLAYFLCFIMAGKTSWADIANVFTEESAANTALIKTAQTCSFCVLAISELTHMLGMTSIRKSVFHNFVTKNHLLWISFLLGIALQFFVVYTPGVKDLFKCGDIDALHWGLIAGLSLAPILVHELVALILFIVKIIKNKKAK